MVDTDSTIIINQSIGLCLSVQLLHWLYFLLRIGQYGKILWWLWCKGKHRDQEANSVLLAYPAEVADAGWSPAGRHINLVKNLTIKLSSAEENMTQGNMRKHINEIFATIKGKYWQKSEEYSPANDAFHNFNAAAQKRNCNPEQALLGMVVKHTVSIDDAVDNYPTSISEKTMKVIDEKITDLLLYYILLHAMFSCRVVPDRKKPQHTDCGQIDSM